MILSPLTSWDMRMSLLANLTLLAKKATSGDVISWDFCMFMPLSLKKIRIRLLRFLSKLRRRARSQNAQQDVKKEQIFTEKGLPKRIVQKLLGNGKNFTKGQRTRTIKNR